MSSKFSLSLNLLHVSGPFYFPSLGWLHAERGGHMTWWLRVQYPVEANVLFGLFSPLTSAEACEKSSRLLWKERCVSTSVRKLGSTWATRHNSADSVPTSNLVCIGSPLELLSVTWSILLKIYFICSLVVDIQCTRYKKYLQQTLLTNCVSK